MKKFRFYTLEELGKRYSGDLIIHDLGIDLDSEKHPTCHFVEFDQLGTTTEFVTLRDESWMGEEVVEKPGRLHLQDDINSETTFALEGSSLVVIKDKRLCDNLPDNRIVIKISNLNKVIQHFIDIKEYLETKEK